ncbi:MAG: LCP family protein, partial [Vallitaleaceae bacterium]|nr:LCP family protein [Vallitaleaceae bacterium]
QDLYIDLEKGVQLLDGDKAEQLVRYRHYQMGDLQRIEVQHQFMVALFDKVKAIDNFSQVKGLATTGYNIFKADFGLIFALDYAQYFYDLNVIDILNSKNMVTIPSYGEKIDEIWYQKWDIDEAHKIVNDLFQ